jgi:hypothetical protein
MLLEEELPGGPILKSRPSTTRFIGLPRSPERAAVCRSHVAKVGGTDPLRRLVRTQGVKEEALKALREIVEENGDG